MAYNTRRSQEGVPANTIGGIGQRRTNPPIGNNFVPGGQLAQNKGPVVQQSQQQQQQQQQRGPAQGAFNQPQNGRQQQQVQNPQQRGPGPQQAGGVQRTVVTKPPQQQPQQQPKPQQAQPAVKPEEPGSMEGVEGEKKKPFWANKNSVKISRKEKQRRRNLRLGKILQPKNAVMILNELVKNSVYNVSDVASIDNQYTATVVIEGITHSGQGRSKMEAKNQAAESALKSIVKNRQLTFKPDQPESADQSMEVDSANESENDTSILPWQHVASFALFKLLSSWGEDPNQAKGFTANSSDSPMATAATNKPAKKMPENGPTLNPLMLMNQMLPNAQFEELPRVGNPPNITFTFKCTVNGEVFTGSGNTKKNAKKFAAYAVCNKILGVQYPPEVFVGY